MKRCLSAVLVSVVLAAFCMGVAVCMSWLWPVSASGLAPAAYGLVQDEGSSLARRTTLNFVGAGVSCADSSGKTECTISGGGMPQSVVTTVGDSTTTTIFTSPTDCSGAVFALAANSRYRFEWYIRWQTDATAVGIAFTASIPAGATIMGQSYVVASTIANHLQGWVTSSGSALPGASPAAAAVDTTYPAFFSGIVETAGTSGNLQLQFGSETGGTETRCMTGTVGILTTLP
jgi:hypothetical protein